MTGKCYGDKAGKREIECHGGYLPFYMGWTEEALLVETLYLNRDLQKGGSQPCLFLGEECFRQRVEQA